MEIAHNYSYKIVHPPGQVLRKENPEPITRIVDNYPNDDIAPRLLIPSRLSTSSSNQSLSTLEIFEKQFLHSQTSPNAKYFEPYTPQREVSTFRRLTSPSTELSSTIFHIATMLANSKGVHSSSEWYPDFGNGQLAENVLLYGELRPLKGVVGFLHQAGINEKYCWLLEGVDGRLYCVDDEDPEGIFDFGFARGMEVVKRVVDEVFGWI